MLVMAPAYGAGGRPGSKINNKLKLFKVGLARLLHMMLLSGNLKNYGENWVVKSLTKIAVAVAGLYWAGVAGAVGFGDANVQSALGQPLHAEISLVNAGDVANKAALTARLASPEAFAAAGVQYPYGLSGLKLNVVNQAGAYFVEVTSQDAVNDPFVSLLVELNWAEGRLMREYTLLLDPPNYGTRLAAKPMDPVVVAPAIVAPVMDSAQVVSGAMPRVSYSAPGTPYPMDGASSSFTQDRTYPSAGRTYPSRGGRGYSSKSSKTITVRRGDTLAKIAAREKGPDVTLEQMLVALYRANARQFDDRNMNRIRAGKILRVPSESQAANVSQREALREIRTQTAGWNAYRQKLASVAAPGEQHADQQETSGKIDQPATAKPPVAQQPKEVLKLSKGEEPDAKGAAATPQQKENAKQEDAIAKQKAAQDDATRAAMLEKNVQQMQKLIDLKAQGAPGPDAAHPAPDAAHPAPDAAHTPDASAPDAAAHPPTPRVPPPPPPASEPEGIMDTIGSLVSDALDNPAYLGGGVAILAGVWYLLRRRKKAGAGEAPKKKQNGNPQDELRLKR
jgi:pilus assembly protein FimV